LLSSIEVETNLLQTISSSGLWKAFTTSWFRIYYILSRFAGLKTMTLSSRSARGGLKSFMTLTDLEVVGILISFIIDRETSD